MSPPYLCPRHLPPSICNRLYVFALGNHASSGFYQRSPQPSPVPCSSQETAHQQLGTTHISSRSRPALFIHALSVAAVSTRHHHHTPHALTTPLSASSSSSSSCYKPEATPVFSLPTKEKCDPMAKAAFLSNTHSEKWKEPPRLPCTEVYRFQLSWLAYANPC